MNKSAFTLAETLITIGIIGIVAAMTIPNLIQHYTNRVVETRLQEFYSTMNQSIKRAEYDYEERESWFQDLTNTDNAEFDKRKSWINKYIAPYTKIIDIKQIGVYTFMFFINGSAAALPNTNGRDWYFFPGNVEKCLKSKNNNISKTVGICSFVFIWAPTTNNKRYYDFAPYTHALDDITINDKEVLKNHETFGCNTTSPHALYCTRLIQVNSWKIPKDYPFKVRAY